MKSAIAAGIGAFAGAAGVFVLPGLLGAGLCLGFSAQLLLVAAGVRIDMPRLAAAAAVAGWPLLIGAAAHIVVR